MKTEQGHLDILVNNATALGRDPLAPPPSWNKNLTIAEQFAVGLRSAFVASYYAARLLIEAEGALVVNVSFYGGVSYHSDPAYAATKAGLDKLTFDMAQDFKPYKLQWYRSGPDRMFIDRIAKFAFALEDKKPAKAVRFDTYEGDSGTVAKTALLKRYSRRFIFGTRKYWQWRKRSTMQTSSMRSLGRKEGFGIDDVMKGCARGPQRSRTSETRNATG